MTGCGSLTPATSTRLPVSDTRNFYHSLQLLGLLIAAALLAAACSSGEPVASPVFEATSPIEELLGVPIDPVEAAAWDDTLRTAGIEQCMRDLGHDDYQHDLTMVAMSPTAVTRLGGTSELAPELVTISSARSLLELMTEPPPAVPQETLDDLFGRPQTPGGCLRESGAAVALDPNRKGGLLAQFTAALDDAYASDPDTIAAAAGWRSCMTTAGHDFESPAATQSHFGNLAGDAGALTEDEIADLDDGADAVIERIIADIKPIAAEEAMVADESRRCALDWLQARSAVRSAVAADFITRLG